jgi:hypothetical protein
LVIVRLGARAGRLAVRAQTTTVIPVGLRTSRVRGLAVVGGASRPLVFTGGAG